MGVVITFRILERLKNETAIEGVAGKAREGGSEENVFTV